LSFGPARLGIYAFLVAAALFFLLPLYVMFVTSIKPMDEIRHGVMLAWADRSDVRASGSRPGPRPAPGCAATG